MGSHQAFSQTRPARRVAPAVALTAVALAAALSCAPAAAHPSAARQPLAKPALVKNIPLADIVAGKGGFIINGTTIGSAPGGGTVAGVVGAGVAGRPDAVMYLGS